MMPATAAACISRARKHVFVVNDEEPFLHLLEDLFHEECLNVTTAINSQGVFERIASLQPDALLVDVVVGQPAALDLLERLHASADTSAIPAMVTSTSHRLLAHAQDEAERYGNHHYLVLPFDLEDLTANIQEMIGEA